MPHIIVEYSQGLTSMFSVAAMLQDLHDSIDGIHNVTKDRIKTRAHKVEDYLVGEDGRWAEMVHIELKLAPDRTDEQKTELSGILHGVASSHLSKVPVKTALTVEVSELHGPSYRP